MRHLTQYKILTASTENGVWQLKDVPLEQRLNELAEAGWTVDVMDISEMLVMTLILIRN